MNRELIDEPNRQFLLQNAELPLRRILTKESYDFSKLMENQEFSLWFNKLLERSNKKELGDIHGSHDYRMENILGKCCILGMSKKDKPFADAIQFILDFLEEEIQKPVSEELSFMKLYHFRDYEKVLACFLPMLGFYDQNAVHYITRQRIDILYEFTRQKCYDIYVDGSKLKGVKKEWQPYVINPELYADGNIRLPDSHDLVLFAGMYPYLSREDQDKIETIVSWLFDKKYDKIYRRYGYFYAPGGSYDVKAIIFKLNLLDFDTLSFDKGDTVSLLYQVYLLSFFRKARESRWFHQALGYLEQYRQKNGHYKFPTLLITEATDHFVIFGGHMNVGQDKKAKTYHEVISTYWLEMILSHCDIN